MGHSRIFALAVIAATWLLLCGRSVGSPVPTSLGLGFDTALGIGATARSDPSAALFANPANLSDLEHRETWMSGRTGVGPAALRFSLVSPLVSGPVWGFGYGAHEGASTFSLGGSRRSAGRMSWGTRLDLLTHNEGSRLSTDFDLDLGWRWRPVSALDAGIAVAHAVGSVEPRDIRAALAWTHPLGSTWSLTAHTGWQGIDGDAPRASIGGLLQHRPVQLACSMLDGSMQLGIALDPGPWRLGYAYDRDAGGSHELALQVRLGASLPERRAATLRAQELEIATRVVEQAERLEASRLSEWRKAAQDAAARGAYEEASGYYAAALVLRPQDPEARAGRRRMRHDVWVHMADSLLMQQNDTAAALALEQALQAVPEDSLTAARLQELRHAALDADRVRDRVARLFDTGLLAFAQQRHLDAARAFDEVLHLDPEHPTAATYRQQARHAHAVAVRTALRSAQLSIQAGDLEAAQSHVRRILAAEPQHAEARALLLQIEAQVQRARDTARREVQQASVVQPSEDGSPPIPAFVPERYEEGMQLYRASDLFGAMQAWEEVARVAPGYQEVSKYLMRVYRVTGLESYTEGRLQEAVEIWQKARRLEPENEQLRRYLDQANAKLARTETPGR